MKTKLFISIMLSTLLLVGCNKNKDTGVIISAGDNKNNAYSGEVITAETDIAKNENTDKQESKNEEELEVVVDARYYIMGTWKDESGNIYCFDTNNRFSGYRPENNENLIGGYDTDASTYINITIPGKYEETVNEDGTITQTKLDDTVLKYSIEKLDIIDDVEATLKVKNNDKEFVWIRPSSVGDNSVENREKKIAEENATPSPETEQVEVIEKTEEEIQAERDAFYRNAIERGLNPETGFSIEETPLSEELIQKYVNQ